jgi:hypothetical protein
MSTNKLINLSSTAAVISGFCSILAALAIFGTDFIPNIPDIIAGILILVADILIIFILMGVYGVQIEESDQTGLTGFAISTIGLMLSLSGAFSPLGRFVLVTGLFILAYASRNTAVLPTAGLWTWATGVALSLIGIFVSIAFDSSVVTIVIAAGVLVSGLGRVWLGTALRSTAAEIVEGEG